MRKNIVSFIFSHLLGQSHDYYQNNFSGNLTNKINDLQTSTPEIIQIFIDRFFSHVLALIIAIFTLWYVQFKFALIMFTWAFIFIVVAFFCSEKIQSLSDSWSELGSINIGKIVDTLSNTLSVRLFARERNENERLNYSLEDTVYAEKKLQTFNFWMWVFYGYSFILMQGVSLYLLLKGIEEDKISIGDFVLVMGINISMFDFLWGLTKEFSAFSMLFGKITQALRTTTSLHETVNKPEAANLILTKGNILFDRVKFCYKGSDMLFDNISVLIPSGQKIGLVGYSGSGKSTFVNLLLRLYDVTDGHIYIDDQDIINVTKESLRDVITMIPQDTSLFHRTLMENIRYGKLDASDNEIISAAKIAHAHEFISKLQLNYESLVGERGVKLSGGQRQRIAISRAILKNAPILILDEATSQLDSITEKYIQESLWDLMQKKTTIIIAHRLSTLLHMDRILVFEKGKIVQDGTHSELLKQGLYKSLWDAQVNGFLPKKK